MTRLTLKTIGDGEARLNGGSVDALAADLGGALLTPDAAGYDEARSIWNAMIDRRPGLIARCADADDVGRAVRFAADHGLLTSVRGGGHNIAGNAVCDGGFMIDLSLQDDVRVDADGRRATAGPGCTLGDLDAATQAHGLATPTGINSTTGLAGLTLGGGFGWLSRKHGLTVDNLASARVVTPDAEQRIASDHENPDLFWALRGGGGNFGVVTSFEYRLHPVGPEVYCGLVALPLAEAPEALRRWRDFTREAPDELSVWAVLRKAPPLPFLPEEWHGQEIVAFALLYAGDPEEGERAAAPVLEFGTPVGSHLGAQPYAGFQQAFDPLLTPGARNYWKSHDFERLSDAALDAAVEAARRLPSPHCELFLASLGGAVSHVDPGATAYAGRSAAYIMNVHGRWETADEDEAGVAWARATFDALTPHAAGSVYVNFLTQDEADRVRAAYGPNYARLREVKRQFDPENLFRMNMNIAP